MTAGVDDSEFLSLYAHKVRMDWGVGVLAGEADGKRRYLFENGAERTLARGFYEMMRRVEKPSADQRAAYVRLCDVLSARNRSAGGRPSGATLMDQIAKFHGTYSSGFSDSRWAMDIRGEGAAKRLPRHRQVMLQDAQEHLSQQAIDALIESRHFAHVWELVANELRQTGLVPVAQLKLKPAAGEQQRALAMAIRELLYGTATYEIRFDRFVVTFTAAFGQYPRWELATALSALVHPTEHVCVDATLFRKQLKASTTRKSVGAQPSSSGYARFLSVARLVSNTLTDQGEVPRDLFDVRDFISLTLKPDKAAPRVRAVRETAKAERPVHDSDDGDSDDDSESDSDD